MAHVRQSTPDSGRGVQAKILKMLQGVSASLGSDMAWMISNHVTDDEVESRGGHANERWVIQGSLAKNRNSAPLWDHHRAPGIVQP